MVGVNLIIFIRKVQNPTVDQNKSEILFNSVFSTPVARNMCYGVYKIYLGMPMDRYEYIRICINLNLDEVIKKYNL